MVCTTHETLLDPLIDRARVEPNRRLLTLLADDGTPEHLSALDLHAAAAASARGIEQAGIGPDDVAVLAIAPLRPLIETFVGALYRGAVPVVSSWGSDRLDSTHGARVASLVRSCGARAVIGTAERLPVLQSLIGDVPLVAAEHLQAPGRTTRQDARGPRAAGSIAYLQFSSGTAGTQKAIPHTHGSVLRYLEAKRQGTAGLLRPEDVIVSWLPLYHDLGLVSGLLTPLVLGAQGVLMSAQRWVRDPKILFYALHAYGGTMMYMPNFALSHCVRAIRERDLEGIDLSRVREVVTGGEPARPGSFTQFTERFGRCNFQASALRAGYGMAELVEGVTVTPPGRPPDVDWIDRERLEVDRAAVPAVAGRAGVVPVVSCGVPMLGVKLRILGERGEDLPERRVGEILVHADYMFTGYHRAPEVTAACMRDGWFASGDLGYVAAGQLFVTGRKTDLIIVGGRKFQPEEFEHVADSIPGLAPGRSVAFAIDDEAQGSDRVVMVCELAALAHAAAADAEQRLAIGRQLRAEVVRRIGATLSEVHLVERGWVLKTSSGKTSRPENRRKYLEQRAGEPRP